MKNIKKYLKAGLGAYSIYVVILFVIVVVIFYYGCFSETSGNYSDRAIASDLLDFLSPLVFWSVIPFFVIWGCLCLFYAVKWFVYEPLKEVTN